MLVNKVIVCGIIDMNKPYRPKIKIVHLLLVPTWSGDLPTEMWESRMHNQAASVECWRRIAPEFSSYVERYVYVNRDELPEEGCADPSIIDRSLDLVKSPPSLSYGHYGVYTAHSSALMEEFGEHLDGIVLIESDTRFEVDPEEMAAKIYRAYEFALQNDGRMVSLAHVGYGVASRAAEYDTSVDMGEWKMVDHFMPAYCYLVMSSERESIKEKIRNSGWHSWDIWLYWNYDCKSRLFATSVPYVMDYSGISMADYGYTER